MDKEKIASPMTDFAAKHPFAAIATVAPTGDPSISHVYVMPGLGFTFYFGTRTSTEKYHNLATDSRLAITFSDGNTLETLQMRGRALQIADQKIGKDYTEYLYVA